jgi:uncharacterized protein (TIGR00251 family)
MIFMNEKGNGVVLSIHVVPGSAKSEIAGVQDDALKVKIAAPPVEGRANAECIRFLSDTLGVRKNQVTITSGHRSRKKTISIEGLNSRDAAVILSRLLSSPQKQGGRSNVLPLF